MRLKSLVNNLKWLYPGMRVKRWLLLVPIGLAFGIAGVVLLFRYEMLGILDAVGEQAFIRFGLRLSHPTTNAVVAGLLITIGLLLIYFSLRQVVRSIASVVSPGSQHHLADTIFRRRYLAQGQRIVVIGGGTGLATMLRGLKQYTSNLVAVVTVTDDGGSSGRLQREMGMLPPGDIRNCLVALADTESTMQELFQYRFKEGIDGMDGHSFGNLLIAAMTRITGDFERAVKETSHILNIRGQVLPSTIDPVQLQAELLDGTFVEGETDIVKAPAAIKHVMLHPSGVRPLDETLRAIENADCIVMGPGSIYTSIVPNILVKGIPEAIRDSDAVKIYVCNVMTQPGETDGFTASDHVRAIAKHSEHKLFQHVIVNEEKPGKALLEKYAQENQFFVEPNVAEIKEMGYRPVVADCISQTNVVRHDPDKLANAILKMIY